MTQLRTTKLALLGTAALLIAGGAQAQSKMTPPYASAPTMVQAAPGFPTISPDQIARDVTEEFNPRTGERELVAAPFDPFEQDPNLAASVNLRSVNQAVAIDGTPLRNGAMLEMDFYYNSPSDDPYDGRGYGDAVFLNGDYAPVVTRDNRILECSSRVDRVVYDHQAYYGGPAIGIYRPYRHYSGHFGFIDRGFGYGYGSRGFRNRGFGYGYGSRGYTRSRLRDARRDNRQLRRELREREERAEERRERERERRVKRDEDRRNLGRFDSYDGRSGTRGGPQRGVNPRPRLENAEPRNNGRSTTHRSTPRPRVITPLRAEPRRESRPAPRRVETPRAEPRRTTPRAVTPRRAEPRRVEPRRAEPRRETRPTPRRETRPAPRRVETSRPKKAPRVRTPQRVRKDPSSNVRRQLDFFPRDGYGGREVVTSRSVDCAREETLRVFLPSDRLDAARFDGLTLLVLDRTGTETPVFIPPNYIEGFRLAASGQVRPQGIIRPDQNGTLTVIPQDPPAYRATPDRSFETASCPTGTIAQPDGTCLLTSGPGYPG